MNRLKFLAVILVAVVGQGALAQTGDLASLKRGYDSAIAAAYAADLTALSVLADKYTNAINTLKLRAQKAGNLDQLLVFTAELDRFARDPLKSVPTSGDPEVVRLGGQVRTLQQQQQMKTAQEILRLTGQHADALTALQKELTRLGKFDEATLVQNERKALAASSQLAAAEATLLGKPAPPRAVPPPTVAVVSPPAPAPVAKPTPPPPAPDTGDWISLFDGKTLNGWYGDPRIWTVKEGALTATTTDPALQSRTHRICSTLRLTNFILRARFMIVKNAHDLNSAIWYRTTPTTESASWKRSGYQFELEAGKWGALKPVKGDYIWDTTPAAAKSLRANGEWNDIEITADGPILKHTFNGHFCGQNDESRPAATYPSGTILLAYDLHTTPYEIRFTDIRVKRLP